MSELEAVKNMLVRCNGGAGWAKMAAVERYGGHGTDTAIRGSKIATEPIEIIVESGDFYHTHQVDCHGGPRFPHLVRDATKPDLLADIARPHAK